MMPPAEIATAIESPGDLSVGDHLIQTASARRGAVEEIDSKGQTVTLNTGEDDPELFSFDDISSRWLLIDPTITETVDEDSS